MVLNGQNYGIWAQDMETLLKNKALWQFTETMVLDLKDRQHKFIIDGKKVEVVGVIMTYTIARFTFIKVGWTIQMLFGRI
jgi:hypothetical protein